MPGGAFLQTPGGETLAPQATTSPFVGCRLEAQGGAVAASASLAVAWSPPTTLLGSAYDTAAFWAAADPTTLTIPQTGYYRISAALEMGTGLQPAGAPFLSLAATPLGGATLTVELGSAALVGALSNLTVDGGTDLLLTAGTTLQLFVFTGTPGFIVASSANLSVSYISVAKVG